MADLVETISAAIRDRIASVTGQAAITTEVGEKHLSEHAKPPRVVWVPQKSPLDAPGRTAKRNDAEIAIDRASFEVHIWHSDAENCRTTMHNIIAASRHIYNPNTIRFSGYTPQAGASFEYVTQGELFVLQAEIWIKVPETEQPTVTATGFSGDVVAELPAGDEVVGDLTQP